MEGRVVFSVHRMRAGLPTEGKRRSDGKRDGNMRMRTKEDRGRGRGRMATTVRG
jgi:hypothetical protein